MSDLEISGPNPVFDPEALVFAFAEGDVDFVLIGGYGTNLHGAARLTYDVDLIVEQSAENLDRAADTLNDLEWRFRVENMTDAEMLEVAGRDAVITGDQLRNRTSTFTTEYGDLDVGAAIPTRESYEPGRGYEELSAEATIFEVLGRPIPTASLAHIVESKQFANRPKDAQAMRELDPLLSGELGRRTPAMAIDDVTAKFNAEPAPAGLTAQGDELALYTEEVSLFTTEPERLAVVDAWANERGHETTPSGWTQRDWSIAHDAAVNSDNAPMQDMAISYAKRLTPAELRDKVHEWAELATIPAPLAQSGGARKSELEADLRTDIVARAIAASHDPAIASNIPQGFAGSPRAIAAGAIAQHRDGFGEPDWSASDVGAMVRHSGAASGSERLHHRFMRSALSDAMEQHGRAVRSEVSPHARISK